MLAGLVLFSCVVVCVFVGCLGFEKLALRAPHAQHTRKIAHPRAPNAHRLLGDAAATIPGASVVARDGISSIALLCRAPVCSVRRE